MSAQKLGGQNLRFEVLLTDDEALREDNGKSSVMREVAWVAREALALAQLDIYHPGTERFTTFLARKRAVLAHIEARR